MKMHTLVAVGTALAVFLVVAIDAPVRAEVVVDGGGSFVTLFGVNATPAGVVFDAREPGALCGATYHIERLGEDPALLALIRDGGHGCRGKITIRVTVQFSYEEIGLQVGERFQVLNPIEANLLSPEPLLARPGRNPRPSNR